MSKLTSLACAECPYVFSVSEIATEDESAWGHPCHGVKDEPNATCEAFRQAVSNPTGEAMNETRKLAKRIVEAMFVNGAGDKASRLVLVKDNQPTPTSSVIAAHQNLGGWCKSALVDLVVREIEKG